MNFLALHCTFSIVVLSIITVFFHTDQVSYNFKTDSLELAYLFSLYN